MADSQPRQWVYNLTTIVNVYELVRPLQARAEMVHEGDPPLVPIVQTKQCPDSVAIARKEVLAHRVPIAIKRRLPGGEVQTIDIRDPSVVFYG